MSKSIYQLKISLRGAKPTIWRRVLVYSNTKLPDLHFIIQIAMGWTNSHLHQFRKNRLFFMPYSEDNEFWDVSTNFDYQKIALSELLYKEKDRMAYEYDFGDSWEHEVVLEKILPISKGPFYPVCIKGKGACPPEDCGGVWGYADMLEILKQPDHEEYQSYIDWIEEDFDPDYFSLDEVNEELKDFFAK